LENIMTKTRKTPTITDVYVQFDVERVHCEGVAEHVRPLGADVPPGWRPAWTYVGPADDDGALQSVEVCISPEDYERIVEGCRRSDTQEARNEALRAQVEAAAAEAAQDVLLRRLGLKGNLPRELVKNAMATPEQWAELEKKTEGDISIEELVRVGGLRELGVSPDQFQDWAFLRADTFDEAWAVELQQEKDKATAPYRAYLEKWLLIVADSVIPRWYP
jgi:hypothetical protein